MFDRLIRWIYNRHGSHYWMLILAGQVGASVAVTLATVAVIGSYFDPPLDRLVKLGVVAVALTAVAVFLANWQTRAALKRIRAWRETPDPDPEETVRVWESATTVTFREYRRNAVRVTAAAIVPAVIVTAVALHVGWIGLIAIALGSVIPSAYATTLSYSVAEFLGRPIVQDVAEQVEGDLPFERGGLPVASRLRIGLPVYTIVCGLVVGAILGDRDGARGLAWAVLIATAVGLFLSTELTVLLSRAITTPILNVRTAMAQVRGGDYTAHVPVTSNDELGELAHDFNVMTQGLAEREDMRSAFGTYVDKDVVRIILAGEFPEGGIETEVSILFCDVRGFTTYAEKFAATEVIATLNELFELIVPIIEKHDGHVDKFLGDGLLAFFGVPDLHADHADRALAAACELVEAVAAADNDLTVAAGVNTGPVVAGAVGGGGRLNFSVIGDAVNVAARVEAMTRKTGDDVLITAATRDALQRPIELVSRGTLKLKGKSEPLELLAPESSQASLAWRLSRGLRLGE